MQKKKKLLTLLLEGDGKMIKRLLVVMLVLGMASTASAVPIITGPTEIDISVGFITLTLEGTAAEASQNQSPAGGGYQGVVWVDYAVYSGQISNVGPLNPSYPAGRDGYNAMGDLANIDLSYMDGTFNTGGGPTFAAAPAAGDWSEDTDVDVGAWFTFDVSMLGGAQVNDTYDVQVLDVGWGIVDTYTVTVVPEPATIALLGLGGLFLRRRRK